jgi:hypothetical protein
MSTSTRRWSVVLPTLRPVATILTVSEPASGGVIWRLYSYPLLSWRQLSKPLG